MSDEESPEEVPRRLRRFYRNGQGVPQDQGQPESEGRMLDREQALMKRKNQEVASKELQKFREKFRRFPRNEEFDEVAEKIYTQVKKETIAESPQHGRFRPSKTGPQQGKTAIAEPGKKSEEAKKASVAELLNTEDFDLEKENDKNGLLSLEDLNLQGDDLKNSLDSLPENDNSENIIKDVETDKNTCSNCKAKTDHLIFCPNCGTAFCNHCAKQAKDAGDKINYTCPKCNTEFKAKKT
ncbi:MAG: hypothetical protein Q7R70_05730 [Candidatus Diapherotrites archaeon]|nr:hypothetical protein [Candidatus Diapherotrites archaeon]